MGNKVILADLIRLDGRLAKVSKSADDAGERSAEWKHATEVLGEDLVKRLSLPKPKPKSGTDVQPTPEEFALLVTAVRAFILGFEAGAGPEVPARRPVVIA